jgi:hypothetical protein
VIVYELHVANLQRYVEAKIRLLRYTGKLAIGSEPGDPVIGERHDNIDVLRLSDDVLTHRSFHGQGSALESNHFHHDVRQVLCVDGRCRA